MNSMCKWLCFSVSVDQAYLLLASLLTPCIACLLFAPSTRSVAVEEGIVKQIFHFKLH